MKCFIIISFFATISFGFANKNEYKRTSLGNSVDKASMKIFQETFNDAKDKNVVASPLGVLTLLSMFSAGAEGKTREEILQLLGSSDYKQLEESYSSLMEKYSSMDPSYFVFANKMYVDDKYTLEEQFADVASRAYKSEVEQVDFGQKKATADSINKWAEEKSKGHIKSPVDEDTIEEDVVAALFNMIFFQGHWHVPFKAEETEEKDFYVTESETVTKPMMKLYRTLYYHEDEEIGAKMVELPYQEQGFRMVVVLPDKKDGLADVVDKVAQKGILEDVFALKPSTAAVALEMPKFEIKNRLELKDILSKLGVSSMFSEGSRGVVREEKIAVSKVFQDAFVKVDEEGATAGAFTGVSFSNRSSRSGKPIEFKVDHPFMFFILHEDIVLFTGTYTH